MEENKPTSIYPASVIQQQFWLVNRLNPETPAHNIPSVFRIKGNLNIDILETAINEIVNRHDVFRTTFFIQSGELKQKIRLANRIKVHVVDFSGDESRKTNSETAQLIQTEIEAPFNLVEGPLIRVRVIKLSVDEHLLILTMHHIVTDLRTKDLFGAELSAVYNSYTARKEILLNEPVAQYADYVVNHNEWLKGDECASKLSYWEKQLKERSETLDFPYDFSRPKTQSFNGSAFPFHLTKERTERLKSFSRKLKVNAFLTLLTVYVILLHRYSRQNDITIGVPLTNRRGKGMDGIMGCFASILPLGVDTSDNPGFFDILKRIRLILLGNHRNQEIPLNSIVNKIQPKRDAAYNPIFQAGFTFEHPMKLEINCLEVESLPVHSGGSQLDIFPVLWESDDGVRGYIEYNTDLLKESTIEQFTLNYKTLLDAVEETPDLSIDQLSILSKSEKEKILYHWNNTAKEYSMTGEGLHNLFEKQVELTPDAVAVEYEGIGLTYDELNQKSNCLAQYLLDRKVCNGTPVGILMHRSLDLVIAIYGIIKAGGVYVPLDPDYPYDRLLYMITDVQMPFILSHKNLAHRLSQNSIDIVYVDSDQQTIESCSSDNPRINIQTTDPVYIIYTSGSTGRPKGVINTHGGICNRILWMQDYLSITKQDIVLQKTPYSFDVSVWEFFWPLTFGAKLVVAPPSSHRDPSEMIQLINQNQVTTIHFVPSMLRVFLEHHNAGTCTSLNTVICSGEALSGELRDTFFDRLDAQLFNLYGPTEAAVDVTAWQCDKDNDTVTVPIGKPIANTKIHILDHLMQPVPVGIPGEIYIGGVQVAKGYHAQEILTKERFIPDPFCDKNSAVLYKTGDLAKYLPDGNIEYLGRTDFQVKIRGLRIELGEIEAVINEHPGITSTKVVIKKNNFGDSKIIAYMIPDKENAYPICQLLDIQNREIENWRPYQLPNGLLISHINPGETDFMYKEIFTDKVYLRHGITLHDGACVFDVGANIGMFTLFVAETVNSPSIYSFEPLPPIFNVMQLNTSLYSSNIKAFPFGLSDKTKNETFTFYPHVSIMSGSHADLEEEKKTVRSHLIEDQSYKDSLSADVLNDLLADRLKSEEFICSLKTISDVISEQNIEQIDLLKIDVEKSEYEVLAGINTDDWAKINQIVVEVHDSIKKLDKIVDLLKSKNYHVTTDEDAEAGLHLLYAVHPSNTFNSPTVPLNEQSLFDRQPWGNQTQLIDDVKQSISSKLPDYMMPSAFMVLKEFPMTQSGKIDSLSLPEPEMKRTEIMHEYTAPQNEIEKMLASFWSNVLEIDLVGIHDNFFELGGNSLLAAYLVSIIQGRLNNEISVVHLFQYPTIFSFAQFLKQGETENESFEAVKIRAELRKDAINRRSKERRRGMERRKKTRRNEDKTYMENE